MIDRVILAIQIPVQGQWAIQVAQPLVRARPPTYRWLIVARTDVEQPRIAIIAVTPRPRKAIGVGSAAPLRHRVEDMRPCEITTSSRIGRAFLPLRTKRCSQQLFYRLVLLPLLTFYKVECIKAAQVSDGRVCPVSK
jgi:hypothetical protein